METRTAIPFWKMSGSGNDFVVIDNRNSIIPAWDAAGFTRAVCRHRISVGADGVVLIESSAEDGIAYNWRYINADGSDGELCGNGAMCGARFAVLHEIAPRDHCFRTQSGIVHATVADHPDDPRVRIAIADPESPRRDLTITIGGRELTLHAILVGVPHAVIVVPDVDDFAPGPALNEIGRTIRHHAAFAPAGVNVNVITIIDRQTVRMRTYERGVEAETLACGTGAVASAIVANALGQTTPPVNVLTSSGRILAVDFARHGDCITRVTLGGDARIIVRGAIDAEALH